MTSAQALGISALEMDEDVSEDEVWEEAKRIRSLLNYLVSEGKIGPDALLSEKQLARQVMHELLQSTEKQK